MKKMSRLILFVLMSFFMILGFQNCGDVSVIQGPQQAQSSIESFKIDERVCARPGDQFLNPTKVYFVVDMSLSNLGRWSWSMQNCVGCTGYVHAIDTSGTDRAESRFNLIRDIIQNFQTQNSFQFSVMGFSDESYFAAAQESCSSPLLNASAALQSTQSLRQTQRTISALGTISNLNRDGYVTRNASFPFTPMVNTSYLQALNCLNDKVLSNLESSPGQPEQAIHHIFFITDGRPSDFVDPCLATYPLADTSPANTSLRAQCYARNPGISACNGDQTCLSNLMRSQFYKQMVEQLKTQSQDRALDFRFQTVYYGPDDESADAILALDNMMRGAHPDQQGVLTRRAADLSQLLSVLQQQLNQSVSVQYSAKQFFALNLTAVPFKGQLLPDSDMNGRADGQTNGPSPSANLIDWLKAEALDTDRDSVPDFIERLRGMNVGSLDAETNRDGDLWTNIEEVRQNTDLRSHEEDDPTPQHLKILFDADEIRNSPRCESGRSEFIFNGSQIPLVKVQAYRSEDPDFGPLLSHDEDVNVIGLFYTAQPLNNPQGKDILFMKVLKVRESDRRALDQTDFFVIGEM